MSLTALKKLATSSKANVLVAVVFALAALFYLGRIDVEQFLDTLIPLVVGWMVAHAGETSAKAIANGRATAAIIAAAEPIDAADVVPVEEIGK